MKVTILAIAVLVSAFSALYAAEEGSWFDMQKCEMCKPLMETKGLMEHMTWEHHKVSSGMLSVCKVDQEYVDSYNKAKTKMDAVAKRWMSGEPVYVCNMCKNFGAIMQSGAVSDLVESGNSFFRVVSTTDPEVVSKIHGWADRTNKEMQALAEGKHAVH